MSRASVARFLETVLGEAGGASGAGLMVVTLPAIARRPDRLLTRIRRATVAGEPSAPSPDPAAAWGSFSAWLPPQGARIVGLGAAIELVGRVDSADFRRSAVDTLDRLRTAGHPSLPEIRPRLIGGFAFSPAPTRRDPWQPFGDGRLLLPRWTYGCTDEEAWLQLAIETPVGTSERRRALAELAALDELLERTNEDGGPGTTPKPEPESEPSDEWTSRVHEIREAIDDGLVSKIVAARCAEMKLPRAVNPGRVLRHLVNRFPPCTGFGLELQGAAFVGATPERLVRRKGDEIATVALAGSAPPGEDEALLERSKDRREHRFVVDDVVARLEPLCREIRAGATRVVRLRNVVHLETPIRAQTREEAGLLEIVAELHPTPAVGGSPRRRAIEWIARREPADRGWYAGPFGWLDSSGDGEFAVALRCGVLTDDRAWLYAGAGIVKGSDPTAEWAETELKMAPMRSALKAYA